MTRPLRWIRNILGSLVALFLVAVATIWMLGGRKLAAEFDIPEDAALAVPGGDSVVAAGQRLAILRGCTGCHGDDLSGQMFVDEFLLGRIAAPNLSTLIQEYSDAELVRALRHGIARDGRSLLIMPSSMLYHLADDDLGAIIAWLRTVPPVSDEWGQRKVGIMGRMGLAMGQFHVEASMYDHRAPRVPKDTTDARTWGEYLARTMCTECHGLQLQGEVDFTPNLALVAGYTEEQFQHLLRTGEPLGGQTLTLMAEVIEGRLVHLTESEVHALYSYLRTLATTAAATRD